MPRPAAPPTRDGLEWIDDEAEEGAQPRACRVLMTGLPMRETFQDHQITELFTSTLSTDVVSSKVLYATGGRPTGAALVKLRSWLDAKEAYIQFNGKKFDEVTPVHIFILTDPSDPPPGFILRLLNEAYVPVPVGSATAGPGPSTQAAAHSHTKATAAARAPSPEFEVLDVKPTLDEPIGGAGVRPRKKEAAKTGKERVPLLNRLGLTLKERIGGRAGHVSRVWTGANGQAHPPGNVRTQSENDVLLARERLRQTRANAATAALAKKNRPNAKRQAGSATALKPSQRAGNGAAPRRTESGGIHAAKAKPAPQRTVSAPAVPPVKTQAQLDEELARYNRARKWGLNGGEGEGTAQAPTAGADVAMSEGGTQTEAA